MPILCNLRCVLQLNSTLAQLISKWVHGCQQHGIDWHSIDLFHGRYFHRSNNFSAFPALTSENGRCQRVDRKPLKLGQKRVAFGLRIWEHKFLCANACLWLEESFNRSLVEGSACACTFLYALMVTWSWPCHRSHEEKTRLLTSGHCNTKQSLLCSFHPFSLSLCRRR